MLYCSMKVGCRCLETELRSMDCWVSQDWDMDTIHIILEVLILLGGLNLAKTKILAKYNTVNQVDRLHGGTKPAHAVRE